MKMELGVSKSKGKGKVKYGDESVVYNVRV